MHRVSQKIGVVIKWYRMFNSRDPAFAVLIKIRRLVKGCLFVSSIIFVFLICAFLFPIYKKTDYVQAAVGTSVASSLNFVSTNSVASVSLDVASVNGSFATSGDGINSSADERAIFSISTNNYTGYTLNLKASGNTTALSSASNTIASISEPTALSAFSSDTSAGAQLNNMWGYMPNYYNSSINTANYYPAPTSSSIHTLNVTNAANSSNGIDNPDTYTIGLGIRADYTAPSGTYTNDTFILEFVTNPTSYSISFADNTGDTSVSGLPSAMSSSISQSSVTLPATIPTRTGFTFSKWCLGTVSNNGSTCAGTEFSAGGSFGIDQTIASNVATLYAVWSVDVYNLVITTDGNVNALTVKEGSTSGESTTCTASSTTFTCADLKSGVSYYLYPVFANGYWFASWAKTDSTAGSVLSSTSTENAYYTMGAGAGALTLTSESKIYMQDMSLASCRVNVGSNGNPTNVGDEITVYDRRSSNYGNGDDASYTVRYINGQCWMTQNLRITGTITSTDSNYSGANFNISAYDLQTNGGNGGRCNGTTGYTNSCTRNSGSTTTGVWYNYCAATSGTVCAASNNTASSEDICPAGWHLPTGPNTTANTDYNKLVGNTTTGNQSLTTGATAFNSSTGGYYNNGTLSTNTSGYWWMSSSSSNTARYYFRYNSTGPQINATGTRNRNYGHFVRCVFVGQPTASLTIDFSGSGITSVKVCSTAGNCSGSDLIGSVSSSGGSVSDLEQGHTYYLYPIFETDYSLDRWSNTGAYGSLSSTSSNNPTFTVGNGDGEVSLISKLELTSSGYMQDQTAQTLSVLLPNDGNNIALTDRRDNNDYIITRINGRYWMTQNLRITGTISATDSNFTGSNFNVSEYSLDSADSSYNGHCSSTNGYSYACAKDSGDISIGVWYNYYAATAGTISTNSNSNVATSDICPAGWKLPTGPNTTSGSDLNVLMGTTASGAQSENTGLAAFRGVAGGYYYNGTISTTDRGYWWSATSSSATSRYYMRYDVNGPLFRGDSTHNRDYAYYVRCIFNS